MYPEFQKRIREEILPIVDKDGSIPCAELLEAKTIRNFIQEVLRIRPVAPVLFLQAGKRIEIGGKYPDLKDLIMVHVESAMQQVTKDPTKFDPDRFDRPMTPGVY